MKLPRIPLNLTYADVQKIKNVFKWAGILAIEAVIVYLGIQFMWLCDALGFQM